MNVKVRIIRNRKVIPVNLVTLYTNINKLIVKYIKEVLFKEKVNCLSPSPSIDLEVI